MYREGGVGGGEGEEFWDEKEEIKTLEYLKKKYCLVIKSFALINILW